MVLGIAAIAMLIAIPIRLFNSQQETHDRDEMVMRSMERQEKFEIK
jgi:hypothetical protein